MIIVNDNFNDIFLESLKLLKDQGRKTNPRGFTCYEIIAPQIILTNPLNCLITIKERKLNYAYLIVEKFTYLGQISKPDLLLRYNKQMSNYINDITNDFDGAYGLRILRNHQLDWCYNLIKNDPDTRQAVITINDFTDRRSSKDIPCTLSFQFLLRDGKLDMIVNMRSNDIIWGTCLDIPACFFVQEVLSFCLGVEVGRYIHQPGSLHYYDHHGNLINELLGSNLTYNDQLTQRWNISKDDTKEAINGFWFGERQISDGVGYLSRFNVINNYLSKIRLYWSNKIKQNL